MHGNTGIFLSQCLYFPVLVAGIAQREGCFLYWCSSGSRGDKKVGSRPSSFFCASFLSPLSCAGVLMTDCQEMEEGEEVKKEEDGARTKGVMMVIITRQPLKLLSRP